MRSADREVAMETKILGNGAYDLAEAAKLTGLRRARVKEWFQGGDALPGGGSVFRSDYDAIDGDLAISFLDLVELFIAGHLREHGVSLQCIRRIHSHLKAQWKTKHPFGRREIRSHGKRLFACEGDEHQRGEVYDVQTRQKAFDTVLLPFLKKIRYDQATDLARSGPSRPTSLSTRRSASESRSSKQPGSRRGSSRPPTALTNGTPPWWRDGMTSRRNTSWLLWNSRTSSPHEVFL